LEPTFRALWVFEPEKGKNTDVPIKGEKFGLSQGFLEQMDTGKPRVIATVFGVSCSCGLEYN